MGSRVHKFSTSGFSLLCGLILFLGHLIFSRDLRNLDPFLMLDDFSGILYTYMSVNFVINFHVSVPFWMMRLILC